jgi:hypothetical protein
MQIRRNWLTWEEWSRCVFFVAQSEGAWQRPRMRRAAFWLGLLSSAGCTQNPYVIGEHVADECQGELAAAIACSGFESEDVGSGWTETTTIGSAAVERTTEEAHIGRGALRARSFGADSVGVVSREFDAVRSGTLYLRAHVFVPADVPTDTINIFFLGDQPAPDPFTGFDINIADGVPQLFSPQLDPARQDGAGEIPRDEWFCFRAELRVSDTEGSIELFVEDESVLQVAAIDTLPDDGVHLFRAGVDWSSEQTDPFEMYLDDVALSTEPIACRN